MGDPSFLASLRVISGKFVTTGISVCSCHVDVSATTISPWAFKNKRPEKNETNKNKIEEPEGIACNLGISRINQSILLHRSMDEWMI